MKSNSISGLLLVTAAVASPMAELSAQSPEALLVRARQLMREVPLIDGHNDLPYAIREEQTLDLSNFDLTQPQPEFMTDLLRLRDGEVGAQFWVAYSSVDFAGRGAARIGLEQVDLIHRMVSRYSDLEFARTAADIERVFADGKIASLIGLEGGHMIENSLGLLRNYYELGVRYMTLTHSANTDWAGSTAASFAHGGLTRFGEEVVREMNRLGMLVDLSHTSDSTMWDALRVSEAPVIFSHSSARELTDHKRNVPDDVLREVGENNGIVMVTFVTVFVGQPGLTWYRRLQSIEDELEEEGYDDAAVDSLADLWEEENPMPFPDLGDVADHIEHIRDVAGIDHVGIGSDFDGISRRVIGLEDVSRFPYLIAELLSRGWSDEEIHKLLGLNFLRVLRQVEQVADRLQGERPPSVAQIEELDGWKTDPPWSEPVN